MRYRRVLATALVTLLVVGCAVRLGGPAPVEQDALALNVTADMTAEQVAQLLKERGVDVAILSGARDSAFFADVATRAGLKMTRPGQAGATTFAFFGPEALGDTTLTLKVPSGGELRLHDALYRIDKQRRLDLMAVRIDSTTNLRDAIRTLLLYVANDVLANAAVLLAIEPPTPALGDSIAVLTRAAFADTWECTKAGREGGASPTMTMRLFYGPPVRMTCDHAERIEIGGGGMYGDFVLPR